MRLGIDDPEQWLENCSRRKLNAWKAYYANEPWGDEQQILTVIASSLKQLVAMKVSADSVEKVLSIVDKAAGYYMPPEWIHRPVVEDDSSNSIEQALEIAKALYGNNN